MKRTSKPQAPEEQEPDLSMLEKIRKEKILKELLYGSESPQAPRTADDNYLFMRNRVGYSGPRVS